MELSSRSKLSGRLSPKKRVGRGYGSGRGGHTSSRGAKGQKARNKVHRYFEGGQLPLIKRLPHLSRALRAKKGVQVVSAAALISLKVTGDITPETLFSAGLIKNPSLPVKVIGLADFPKALSLRGFSLSQGVRERLLKAGGSLQ